MSICDRRRQVSQGIGCRLRLPLVKRRNIDNLRCLMDICSGSGLIGEIVSGVGGSPFGPSYGSSPNRRIGTVIFFREKCSRNIHQATTECSLRS
jgi:hypothetical protein